MGDNYLERALAADEGHEEAVKLKILVYGEHGKVGEDVNADLDNDFIKKVRSSGEIILDRDCKPSLAVTSENLIIFRI